MKRNNVHQLSRDEFERAVRYIRSLGKFAARPCSMAYASLVDGSDGDVVAHQFNVTVGAVSHARQRVFKAWLELHKKNPYDAAKQTVQNIMRQAIIDSDLPDQWEVVIVCLPKSSAQIVRDMEDKARESLDVLS